MAGTSGATVGTSGADMIHVPPRGPPPGRDTSDLSLSSEVCEEPSSALRCVYRQPLSTERLSINLPSRASGAAVARTTDHGLLELGLLELGLLELGLHGLGARTRAGRSGSAEGRDSPRRNATSRGATRGGVVPPRRGALESDVLVGRVDAPRPALRVLSSQLCSLDLWGSFRLGARTGGLVRVPVDVSSSAKLWVLTRNSKLETRNSKLETRI